MADFQKSLQGAIPATSPNSNIAGQFNSFRTFVLSSLASLQQQVELLTKQSDQLEMRSRRKMLLVHGVSEGNDTNLTATVSTLLSSHLKMPHMQVDCFSRCHRLGKHKGDKPRAILIKFRDLSTKNEVWFSKTALKNSGITVSEFLTKERHDAFMAARLKFGVSKCWTKEGVIIVIGHDGKRLRMTTKAQVNSIQIRSDVQVPSSAVPASRPKTNVQALAKPVMNEGARSRRIAKK